MEHLFIQGKKSDPTFILLHGTGGDERSLIPLAQTLAPDANYLAPRGEVNEHGYLRFFKRYADASYDLADLDQRGRKLNEFLTWASDQYQFDLNQAILLGFSNGSNIASHLLFHLGSPIKRAILMAPLYPLNFNPSIDLSDKKIFLSMGQVDPYCSMTENQKLIDKLNQAHADVQYTWVQGHEVTHDSLEAVQKWLASFQD